MSTLVQLAPPAALLALGAVLLLWGADTFMDRVLVVARLGGVSALVVGALAAGAEPEELATAVSAAAAGRPYLAVGDVVGANVATITLGLGIALVVGPRALADGVDDDTRWRGHAFAAGLAGVGAAATLLDGRVERWEGAFLVAAYVVFVAWVWRDGAPGQALKSPPAASGPRGQVLAVWALGLLAMVVGGMVAMDGATELASASGWGQRVTGFVVLGLTTSLEVFALVRAARRHRLSTVAVAAVLGSVAFNATLTLGVAALVAPLVVPGVLPGALAAAVLPFVALVAYRGPLARPLGVGLVAGYVGFAAWAAGAFA